MGDPNDESTLIGPMISKEKQLSVLKLLEGIDTGAEIFEVPLPGKLNPYGCWVTPKILVGLDDQSPLVQEELFAPLLIVQEAVDLDHAITLCNGVSYGLISALFSDDPDEIETFRSAAECALSKSTCQPAIYICSHLSPVGKTPVSVLLNTVSGTSISTPDGRR